MRKREDLTGFGARLRQLREERNISQKDMIKSVNDYFGLVRFKTVQAYNRYEIFNAQPDIDLLICFAHVLNMTVDYLVGNNVTPEQSVLHNCISKVQKIIGSDPVAKFTCFDNKNGFVEIINDERDEKIEASFTYEDFISFVNSVESQLQDDYRFEFIGTFFDDLFTYACDHFDLVNYTIKNKNANLVSKEWVTFNKIKGVMQDTESNIKFNSASAKDGDK